MTASTTTCTPTRLPEPGDVYSDPERSGGGQGHLQATHSVGLMLHMTGLRPVSVLALMENLDTRVDVVDAMIAQMDNGALASVGSSGTLHAGARSRRWCADLL